LIGSLRLMAMKQPNLIPERPSEQGREMLAEKLKELEGRVKAVVELVAKVRREKASLEKKMGDLQGVIKDQAERVRALEAGRKKDQQQLARTMEEREEIRLKVDRLLEDIGRIEASVEPEA